MKDEFRDTIYCYPDSNVLINKYDIRDKDLLEKLEIQIFSVQMMALQVHPERIKSTCNEMHIRNLHKYLFEDLYDWAGEFRKLTMYKSERVLEGGSAEYSKHEEIHNHLKEFFEKYNAVNWSNKEDLIENATNFLSDLWNIHPFREGNTRSCTAYMWHFLNAKSVYLDLELFKNNPFYVRDALVMANYNQKQYLTVIVKDALSIKRPPLNLTAGLANIESKEKYQIAKEELEGFRKKYYIKKNKETR